MGSSQTYDIKKILPKFPSEFQTSSSKISKDEVFSSSDIICLYFSAHWCGPCRKFTPSLSEFYKEINSETKQIEIIFCSSDQDQNQFNEYFKTMPWIAIPFDSEAKDEIAEELGVSSIPTLIVFDKDGNVLDNDGRSTVMNMGLAAIKTWKEKMNENKEKMNENKEKMDENKEKMDEK